MGVIAKVKECECHAHQAAAQVPGPAVWVSPGTGRRSDAAQRCFQ